MPEALKKEEVEKGQDPSVAKQYDDETPTEQKFEDFYKMVDGIKISMFGTLRQEIGPVSRAMAVAKRSGPDFLFLANAHSQKFDDIEKMNQCQIIFHNSSNQDWACVSGVVKASDNEDPRIKEIYSKPVSAWFGDLGDGVHTGGPEDPRMKLIEVQAKYISYWKHEAGALGFMKEVGGATLTGGVAKTGTQRQMKADEIEQARSKHATMTS